MKPPIPTPEPVPVQTLRRYGLNASADEVAEVYRQHGELVKALGELIQECRVHRTSGPDYAWSECLCGEEKGHAEDCPVVKAQSILTTATQKKG